MSADRYFVAGLLPAEAAAAMLRFQPDAGPLLRCTPPDQLHLTLHYVGAGDERQLADAFVGFAAATVSLAITGVGSFGGADQATTLWAGVHLNDELHQLHTSVAHALAVAGFRPEDRPYRPHISLARCQPSIDPSVVEAFLGAGADLHLDTNLTTVGLFASSFVGGVPHYRLIAPARLDR